MKLRPPDLCLIKLSHPIRTHIYYRKHRPLVRTSQGWSGAAGIGQHLRVMDDGSEHCLMGVSTRWWKVIRVNNGHPQFLLYSLGFVSIRELQWRSWSLGSSYVTESIKTHGEFLELHPLSRSDREQFLHRNVFAPQRVKTHARSHFLRGMNVVHVKQRQVLSCALLISSCPRSHHGRQCLWPDL